MVDRDTIAVYNQRAQEWVAQSDPRDLDHVAWVQASRVDGPVLDIGCGPGWHLPTLTAPSVGLDASATMLDLAADAAPGVPRILGSASHLPVASGTLGGAVANRVYLHLPSVDLPMALADLHRSLAEDAPAFLRMIGDERGDDFRDDGPFGGRLFSGWSEQRLTDICHGAGFEIERFDVERFTPERSPGRDSAIQRPGRLGLRLRRSATLADSVGAGMRLLLCGLNPSPASVEAGVGFARPGNRFWPAAAAAGLSTRDRDPVHALTVDRLGMTDLVKRPTRTAAELTTDEYRAGVDRVRRLVDWLRPGAICFVGLAGWRAAVDRKAVAGPQPDLLGSTPVYLMPSTSGLNAHSQLPDLTAHLRSAAELAATDMAETTPD